MQMKLSNIAIGKNGQLAIGGTVGKNCGTAIITQKSPLYDRLGSSKEYMNPMALSGPELINARFGMTASERFANAIMGAVESIRAGGGKLAPGTDANKQITRLVASGLGDDEVARNISGSRNMNMLALFDAYCLLGMEPELSVGQNYDLALVIGGRNYHYPDDRSRYKGEEREEQHVAFTPAEACSAVHLVLGREQERLAEDRKRDGDRAGWRTELNGAIMHYEEAVAFDIGNEPAIYNLSGAYAMAGQHGKAVGIYKKAFELSQSAGTKAYYSSFLAENAIYSKNVQLMISSLRVIEAFSSAEPDYVQARQAVQELQEALSKALEK